MKLISNTFLSSIVCLITLSAIAETDVAPGQFKRLPCKSAPELTYDLYVPKSYATDTARRFPVLFLSSPGANPGFMSLESWAEKNGVLLVGINDSKNDISFVEIARIQDAVIQSVEATLRVHPCLRFSIGVSGAGWASMHMAMRHPDSHAGVIVMAHSGNGTICAKHIAVAFIHGDKDTVHPNSAVEAAYQGFKKRGNPVRDLLVPGRGHESATKEENEMMLNWMLGWERLTHPKLPPADKAAALAEVKQRVEHCADIKNPQECLDEAELLCAMPDEDKRPEYKTLVQAWFNASMNVASTQTDDLARHELLMTLSDDPRAHLAPAADQSKLTKELTELRKKPEVKNEWEAHETYERIAKFEAAAGKNKSRLKEAIQGYDACAKKYPNTKAGKLAASAAERLTNMK